MNKGKGNQFQGIHIKPDIKIFYFFTCLSFNKVFPSNKIQRPSNKQEDVKQFFHFTFLCLMCFFIQNKKLKNSFQFHFRAQKIILFNFQLFSLSNEKVLQL
jgi:hypothetical protein